MSDNFDILDAQLDDLADLPEFGVFPVGAHRVTVEFAKKEINGKKNVELSLTLIEHVELADPSAVPMSPGAKGSVLYSLENEFGQGKLKEILKPFAAALGTGSLRDTMEGAKGMEVTVVTKQRQNKDKTQTYLDVTKVII